RPPAESVVFFQTSRPSGPLPLRPGRHRKAGSALCLCQSGRWDSNPRRPAWELGSHLCQTTRLTVSPSVCYVNYGALASPLILSQSVVVIRSNIGSVGSNFRDPSVAGTVTLKDREERSWRRTAWLSCLPASGPLHSPHPAAGRIAPAA